MRALVKFIACRRIYIRDILEKGTLQIISTLYEKEIMLRIKFCGIFKIKTYFNICYSLLCRY